MNRSIGFIVAALALVLLILSIMKILPGFTITGTVLLLLSILIIGLSFIPKPTPGSELPMPLAQSLVKIFYAPAEVFRKLQFHPRWLVAAIIMAIFSAGYNSAFLNRLTPEVVVGYSIDRAKEMPMVNDEARNKIEEGRAIAIKENKSLAGRLAQAINGFVGLVFWIALLGTIFFLFVLALGGKINFWQAFSVVAYSMFPVWIINLFLSFILLFIKESSDIHPILGRSTLVQDNLNFLADPAQSPVLYSVLGMFGILSFYLVWLRVVGLKNAGEKVTPTIAWTVGLGIWIIGILFSGILALIFPSFIK